MYLIWRTMKLHFFRESCYCYKCGIFMSTNTERYHVPYRTGLRNIEFCCKSCKPKLEKRYKEKLYKVEHKRGFINLKLVYESDKCIRCNLKLKGQKFKPPASLCINDDDGYYICYECKELLQDEYLREIQSAKDRLLRRITNILH